MPRFLAPITVAQEYVTSNETISGSETILGSTSGQDSYWTMISVQSGLSADYGHFVHNVSAVSYYGSGINLTEVNDVHKLPLSGGILTGKLDGNDANFSNSLYATTISAVDFIGNGSLLTGVAKLDSPTFVGTPAAPTAPAGTDTTQIATTQFVIQNRGDRYLTTSTTSLALANNQTYSLTAGTGLSYTSSQPITLVANSTNFMNADVVSYNISTGAMVINNTSRTGTGTFSAWTINVQSTPVAGGLIAGNNLSDVTSPSAALLNLGGFPYTGGTLTNGLTGTRAQFNSVTFTPNATAAPYELGKVWYDTNKDALAYYNSVSSNILHIGQEIQQYVRNATADTIKKGDVVTIRGFTNQSPDVILSIATSLSGSIVTGVANQDIPSNSNGYITTIGEVANFDTSRFTAGEDLFLSPISAGKLTNVLPTNPYFAMQVGVCMYSHPTNGKLLVYTQYLGTAANTIVGTLDITQLPTIPISAGGTGQANAAAALSALGGFPISGGTITDGLTANSGTFSTYLSSPSISGTHYGDGSNLINIPYSVNIQVYNVGTFQWNKPTNAKTVNIVLIGAGGGGASGRKSLSGTAAFGGGGGGGGAFTSRTLDASLLSSSEIVVVGAAGTGGASISANSTNGLSGSNGGDSKFGTWLFAQGGGGAPASTTSSGGAGSSASTRGMFPGGNGGSGTSTNGSAAGSSATAAAGGGGGAGLAATPAASFGGNGGTAVSSFITGGTSSGGGLNSNGVAGSSVPNNYPMPGSGGSGGGSSTTTNSGSGGAGGNYGGGGGGGGAALDNVGNSGAGGPGSNGLVIVTTYF